MTQINLFSRRHRGMLENEKAEDYFTSNNTKMETEQDEEQWDSPESFIDTSPSLLRFTIPELPVGEQLVLNLKTTWGDRHYIGLNGIEVFSSEGYLLPIKKVNW